MRKFESWKLSQDCFFSSGRTQFSPEREMKEEDDDDGLCFFWCSRPETTNQIVTLWKAPPRCRTPRSRAERPPSDPGPERTETHLQGETTGEWLVVTVTAGQSSQRCVCACGWSAHLSSRSSEFPQRHSDAAPPPGPSTLCSLRLTSDLPTGPGSSLLKPAAQKKVRFIHKL